MIIWIISFKKNNKTKYIPMWSCKLLLFLLLKSGRAGESSELRFLNPLRGVELHPTPTSKVTKP